MVQKIALFNHKGGVSKTTTTFNLGWMLATKGKRVILADTDPQCNLTGMVLGEGTENDEARIERIYQTHSNIKTNLAPAFESQPKVIEPVQCLPVAGQERLFLMPGHVGFAEYEVTLGVAQELSGSIQALRNIPGAITELFNKTAKEFNADYILIDMSPSLNAINQNLLMTSNFFLVPTTADFFSLMAIDSLANILPKWSAWGKQIRSQPVFRDAAYPFPEIDLHFLGTIVQNFRIIRGKETAAFETWIHRIEQDVTDKLIPVLEQNQMLLPRNLYTENGVPSSFTLTKIPNFNSLIALSQEYQTPVYALTPEQLSTGTQRWYGQVLEKAQAKQNDFRDLFSDLADKVIGLSSGQYALST
jgi:cellulose biosynthesis protein BcsQ